MKHKQLFSMEKLCSAENQAAVLLAAPGAGNAWIYCVTSLHHWQHALRACWLQAAAWLCRCHALAAQPTSNVGLCRCRSWQQ